MQNRVQWREEQSKIYEKLLFLIENYENLSGSVKTLHVKQLRLCKTLLDIYNAEGDLGLGDISKVNVNETSNFITTRDNRLEKPTNYIPLPDSHNTYVIIKTNPYQPNAFNQSGGRLRCITRHFVHDKRRDREPSRIPMKKLVHLMRKNKTRRSKIKRFIRQYIPKSSSWHINKYVSPKPTNVNIWQFKKPCRAIKKTHKLIKKESQKIAIMRTGRTKKHKLCKLNNHKIKNTNKCNMLGIKTSDNLFLFVCGDIELNPGPINTSNMSVLTTRLARIGRQPVNIVGDGNCFFGSVSHQLYGTEDCHLQIRALAIQHLINCPEHFVEYNTDQSWLQYLQNMSTLGTWADHIIIQAVANKHNLRINITESAPNFSESTTVSSIYTGSETRQRSIYIGHLDELHYVSTTPITQSISTQLINRTTSDKPKEISRNSQSNKTSLKEITSMKNAEKRKQYMKEYMKQKRKNNEFKKKEIERKKLYNENYKNSKTKQIRESWQKASAAYLISPRIPFMQVRELPSGGQLSIHGNVVNVPADVNSTVSVLPRPINESQTIPIKLKRRLGYKRHYQFQNIRLTKVLEAAQYLVRNSEIFKNEGIQVMDNYISNTVNNEDEWSEFITDDVTNTSKALSNNSNSQSLEKAETETRNDTLDNDTDDEWCETTEQPSGVMDTLLQEPDITQDGDRIISFAPGEGNRPLGIFMDKDSEYLSFPTIYCGKRQADNSERLAPVHYSTMCKWELRSKDRRVAQSVPNIFYKLKKLQIRQVQGSASLLLRKCNTKGKTFTAGDLKSESSVNNLINLDEEFRVLRNLRGSPPYFERCKKDLFAMIRQLGNPTWFCSFSAAETRWIHLIKILGRLIDKKDYTDDEVRQMTWQKKSELIQKDPVTCARNFEHMVQLFIHNFIKSSCHPIGEVVDFFYRVEFQQRGSPHIHGLFWIKNAPEYGKNCDEDIIKFVDSYVLCKADSDDLNDLVNLQRHKHSKTCKKKGHPVCRFNFPLPPMPRTMILEPLSELDLEENEAKELKEALGRIRSLLNSINADKTMTFVDFLEKLGLSEQKYTKALRLSLKHTTLLLKRSPSEIRINCYNPHLLKAWQANMDIQFVLDPYACAVYILSYITKGQRGMSKLLRKACEEAKEGNKNIVNKVRHIGNKFLNAVEISAQEAVYLVLQMPLRRSSREFQFINTSDPDERTFLLKSMDKIKELPDNSIDIESDNVIKRYQ